VVVRLFEKPTELDLICWDKLLSPDEMTALLSELTSLDLFRVALAEGCE